jgi:hypothetical protein
MSTTMRNANAGSCSSGALHADRDRVTELLVTDGIGAAVQAEQRVADGHELAHLGHELDHAVGAPRELGEARHVDRHHHAGATAGHGPGRLAQVEPRAEGRRVVVAIEDFRVDVVDHRLPLGPPALRMATGLSDFATWSIR